MVTPGEQLSIFMQPHREAKTLTVGEQRLWKLPEEGLEEAADDVQVLPSLHRNTQEKLLL